MREHDNDETTRVGPSKGAVNSSNLLSYQGEPISHVGEDVPQDESLGSSREKLQKLRAAARSADCCGWCDESLAPEQPIWQWVETIDDTDVVVSTDPQGHVTYGDKQLLVPFCADCAAKFEMQTMKIEPCVGCARLVHITAKAGILWLRRGRKAFCCEECISKPELVRKAAPEVGTRACACCGNKFTPKRLDAHYCSPACRQKSFRKSKKDSAA